jgi:hypothetical protein
LFEGAVQELIAAVNLLSHKRVARHALRGLVDRQPFCSIFGDNARAAYRRVATITMFIGTWNPSLSICSVSTVAFKPPSSIVYRATKTDPFAPIAIK